MEPMPLSSHPTIGYKYRRLSKKMLYILLQDKQNPTNSLKPYIILNV